MIVNGDYDPGTIRRIKYTPEIITVYYYGGEAERYVKESVRPLVPSASETNVDTLDAEGTPNKVEVN